MTPASCGRIRSVSMTMPSSVLIMVSPSAPASTQALRDLDDVGDVRAQLGEDRDVARQLLAHQRDDLGRGQRVAGEDQAAVGDVGAGDVDLDADDGVEGVGLRAAWPRRRRTRSLAAAGDRDQRAGARPTRSQARSSRRTRRCPGPCRPIELSMPLGVSAMRGVPRPDRGSAITDLVTNAPELGDVEEAVQLLAVGRAARGGHQRVGQPAARARRSCRPRGHRVARSWSPCGMCGAHQWPPVRGAPTASSGTRPHARPRTRPSAPGRRGRPVPRRRSAPSGSARRRRRPASRRSCRRRRRRPSTPRRRPAPRRPAASATRVIDCEHRHRAAAVDDAGAGAADDVGQHVGDPAAGAQRAVVGGDGDAVGRAAGLDDAEEPVLARRAEHHLDVAAPLAQGGGQPEQRRAAVAAADEDARRPARWAAGTAARAGRRRRPCRAARSSRQPPGARPVRGDDDVDGAAVGAARADLVDREAAAQQGRGGVAADGQRDELARAGPARRRPARRTSGAGRRRPAGWR